MIHYFDTHLHVPTPDQKGLDRLRHHLDTEKFLVGALLILNTPAEAAFIDNHLHQLPPSMILVPYFQPGLDFSEALTHSGWYKIHPDLHRIDASQIPRLVEEVLSELPRLRGLIVHCFPWGPNLAYCISIPLVVALAQACPNLPILAAHGGGYESWALRAHTGSYPNVLYDFSASLSYFRGSDLLRPLTVYARTRPQRLLFGTDWPTAPAREQLEECLRLAAEVGIDGHALEMVLMDNIRTYWPGSVPTVPRT
jgi:predicted TIM-barrel fold metal-dependent hydrolase